MAANLKGRFRKAAATRAVLRLPLLLIGFSWDLTRDVNDIVSHTPISNTPITDTTVSHTSSEFTAYWVRKRKRGPWRQEKALGCFS